MTAKHSANRHNRIVTAFVRKTQPLEDGKVRCAGCSAVVRLTPNGKIRAHKSPAGEPCAYKVSYAAPVHLDEIPAVVVRPAPKYTEPAPREPKPPKPPKVLSPSRLDIGSSCRECGVWLPGERSLCGMCYATKHYAPKRPKGGR